MKILVTGATGVYGRSLVERLHRAGHDVVAMARRPPRSLPRGVQFAQGDVADADAVLAAMDGCEVVAHLAFVVSAIKSREESWRISVGGTQNVVDAMKTTGARRLVFASSIMSYGANPDNPPMFTEQHEQRPSPDYWYGTEKLAAERVILESGVEAVLARTAVTVGRNIDNLLLDIFAAPAVLGIKGADMRWQLVHQDDIGRFLALACEGGPAGPVNVAPSDFVALPDIARMLGKRYVEVSASNALKAVEYMWDHDLTAISPGEAAGMSYLPRVATDRLRDEWGFECAWSTRDGLLDLQRAVAGVVSFANRRYEIPWRLRFPTQRPGDVVLDEETARPALPCEAGELDTVAALRHPTYRAATGADLPLSALTLSTNAYLLRAAVTGTLDAFGLPQEQRDVLGGVGAGVFGHRLYVNDDVPAMLLQGPGVRRRMLRANYAREVRGRSTLAAETVARAVDPAALGDVQLEARLSALRDELAWFWAISATGAALDGEFLRGINGLVTRLPDGTELSAVHAAAGVLSGRLVQARAQAERTAVAISHALAAALRERAARLVAAGDLAAADDATHLTWDELMVPPADLAALVERRRGEQELLAAQALPATISAGLTVSEGVAGVGDRPALARDGAIGA